MKIVYRYNNIQNCIVYIYRIDQIFNIHILNKWKILKNIPTMMKTKIICIFTFYFYKFILKIHIENNSMNFFLFDRIKYL